MALSDQEVKSLGDPSVGEVLALAPAMRLPVYDGALPLKFIRADTLAASINPVAGAAQLFANIAALRANTATLATSYVEGYYAAGDQGGGHFVATPSDTTSPDDGAEIIVDAADKRHKRQWSGWFDFRWAGAVGNGVFNNATPINRFCYLARKASDAGYGFNLLVPPGHYKWNGATTGAWWLGGIKKLVISGYGTQWTNTNPASDRAWPLAATYIRNGATATYKGFLAGHPLSCLINNTAVGDTSFTTTTPADAGNWADGDPILLTSVDTQWQGFPINPGQFEYNTVVGAPNTSTGVVTLKYPIRHQHLTSYPDGGVAYPGGDPCGKGRAWVMSAPVYVVDPLTAPSASNVQMPWDIDHEYRGLTINNATVAFATYMTIAGKNVRFIDCTTIGISPSGAGTVLMKNCEFTELSEPDKLVGRLILDNCRSPAGIGFQSSSVEHVEVRGGHYAAFGCGTAKYMTITNPDIDSLSFDSVYGMARNITILGGTVRSVTNQFFDVNSNPLRVIDGVDVTYSNGVISVTKGSAAQPYWGLIQGAQINLANSTGTHTLDPGTGVITSITEDSTHILFATSWPWANLAAALGGDAGTGVRVFQASIPNVVGTTGCDGIRNMAEASRRGRKQWEFWRGQLVNINTTGGSIGTIYGSLTNITLDVKQITSVASRILILSVYLYKDTDFTDRKLLDITINLDVRGRRVLTPTGFTGTQSGDLFKLDGVAITVLPTDRVCLGGGSYDTNLTFPATYGQVPVVTAEITADAGWFGDTLVRDVDGGSNSVTRVTGLIPA